MTCQFLCFSLNLRARVEEQLHTMKLFLAQVNSSLRFFRDTRIVEDITITNEHYRRCFENNRVRCERSPTFIRSHMISQILPTSFPGLAWVKVLGTRFTCCVWTVIKHVFTRDTTVLAFRFGVRQVT